MKVHTWNTRGFNDPIKQKEVVRRIRDLGVSMVCLVETRIKNSKMQSVLDRWFQGWEMLHNYAYAVNGRVWILWRDMDRVELVGASDQYITVKAVIASKLFYFTGVYASNFGDVRKRLWDSLLELKGVIGESPWLLAGDFNVTAQLNESSGHEVTRVTNDMLDFQQCLQDTGLFDHSYSGCFFTWGCSGSRRVT
ncbi:MAG: hypothetical protein Q8807_03390 ['Waltheria sp.' little leaf phytoplasma]|nr:hypothetical protein ['Waltheria sp.' little leaf phytoplasma]